MMPDEELFSEF